MFKKTGVLLSILFLGACATQENKIAEYLKKNPKIVFDVIEENPEQFIDVVNKAARKAQEAQYSKQLSEAQKQQQEQLNNPLKPDLRERHLLFGLEKSPITIVEYADFQCPACKMAHETLKKVKEKYKNEVRFYYKNMPLDFHKMAMPAARYFEAIKMVDKVKAEKFFNLVFDEQNQLRSEDFLKNAVKRVGLDPQSIIKKINSVEIDKSINEDMNEFQKLGFTGTPVIIVNGVALNGAQPIEEIERVIQLTSNKK